MGAVIRCDPLDGAWQTMGAGRFRGVVPENIEATANTYGPDQLTFTVKAVEPAALRPDLLPYTPVELEVDGMLVWAGRIKARPSTETDHSVQCEGWQYHLDDDVLDRVYVHTRLGDYRDQRTFLTANLPLYAVAGSVVTDGGTVQLGWPLGSTIPTNGRVGVTIDLGVYSYAKRAVITWGSSNNTATVTFYATTHDIESEADAAAGQRSDFGNFVMNTGATGTLTGTAATARRYVTLYLYNNTGAPIVGTAADVWAQVRTCQLFRDVVDESGNASIMKADKVVKDALPTASLLNQSTGMMTAGTFSIPEYLTAGYQTPREVIDSVNAYENYQPYIAGPDLKTLAFRPKPSAPLFEAGEWSGSTFADASTSGDEIYSRAVVDGTGPDGGRIVSLRNQTGTLVDRNGFTRSKVLSIRSAGTSAVYDRFGDLWLTEHLTSRFSGKLETSQGIRRVLGGSKVAPQAMLLAAGEKLRLAHRIDPDTGGWGRDGRIAAVTYRHTDRSVSIDLDDRRDHFEQILNRYGVLVDQL